MEEGLGWLFGIVIVFAVIIVVAVYVIVPATLIIIGSITIAGVASGIYVAGKNFGELIGEAHKTVK